MIQLIVFFSYCNKRTVRPIKGTYLYGNEVVCFLSITLPFLFCMGKIALFSITNKSQSGIELSLSGKELIVVSSVKQGSPHGKSMFKSNHNNRLLDYYIDT